jgi:arginase
MTSRTRAWRLLGVPIDCIAFQGGTELAPGALRASGLVAQARLEDAGDAQTRLRTAERDPASGLVAADEVFSVTRELRRMVAATADEAHPLLVAGGCCTLLPGVMGGLRADGEDVGLVYLDGHVDLYDGRTSPTGEAADMPLAVLLGAGPPAWAEAAGPAALLAPPDVTLLGPRDEAEARGLQSLLPDDFPGMTYLDASAVVKGAPGDLGAETASRVAREHADGFWVHLDLDVLDELVFPATDYLSAGGLDWPTLCAVLTPLVRHPGCRGLDVTCFNPEKDPGGVAARKLVGVLSELTLQAGTFPRPRSAGSVPFGSPNRR